MERASGFGVDPQQQEQIFQSAFTYASIGMAIVSIDGQWLDVNPSLCELVGYSKKDLLQLTFQDITHPDDLLADLAFVQQLLDGEIRTYKMEKRYFHQSGHILWVLLSVSLMRDASGQPLYFISQITDITERKLAGFELEQMRQSLDERVEELEIALAEVKRLEGVLAICSYCKNIRNHENFWVQVEEYISRHSDAMFSHSICPKCYEKAMAELSPLK